MKNKIYRRDKIVLIEKNSLLEKELQIGKITKQPKKLPGHEGVFVIKINNKLAIYKPRKLEKAILGWEKIKPGTYYKHERAAYLISDYIGLDIVPVTIIRNPGSRYGLGSIQLFIPNTKTLNEWSPYKKPDKNDSKSRSRIEMMARLALFDILIHETDRHSGNVLFNEEFQKKNGQVEYRENIFATDNGLSFGNVRLRNFSILTDIGRAGWLCGEKIPKKVAKQFNNFVNSKKSIQDLKKILKKENLLTKKEIVAFFARVNYLRTLLNSKNFPPASKVIQTLNCYLPDV